MKEIKKHCFESEVVRFVKANALKLLSIHSLIRMRLSFKNANKYQDYNLLIFVKI